MHHMTKDTHTALANIKCTLTKREINNKVTEQYTQLTAIYRYCMTLFLNRRIGAVTTGSSSEFQALTVRGTN